jgi:penicillin-binding protein 1A
VCIPCDGVSPTFGQGHQVGSTFKAYTYSTALANGYSPGSSLLDANPNFPGYSLQDFDGRQMGNISLATSLQLSRNISSVRLFQQLGWQRVFAEAEALGIPPWQLSFHGLSATLGTNYMSMLDHVGAFGTFANGGRRVRPWAIASVNDSHGKLIFEQQAPRMEQVIPTNVAVELSRILKGAVPPEYHMSIPMAAKSGTTEYWKDSWFIGYTTDLVVGSWMGHIGAHGEEGDMNTIYGPDGAGLMMRDFLRDWYQSKSPPDFGASASGVVPCSNGPSPAPKPSSPSPSGSSAPSPSPSYPRAPFQYPSPTPGTGVSPIPCSAPRGFEAPGAARTGGGGPAPGGQPPPATPPAPLIYTPPAYTPRPQTPCPLPRPICP